MRTRYLALSPRLCRTIATSERRRGTSRSTSNCVELRASDAERATRDKRRSCRLTIGTCHWPPDSTAASARFGKPSMMFAIDSPSPSLAPEDQSCPAVGETGIDADDPQQAATQSEAQRVERHDIAQIHRAELRDRDVDVERHATHTVQSKTPLRFRNGVRFIHEPRIEA